MKLTRTVVPRFIVVALTAVLALVGTVTGAALQAAPAAADTAPAVGTPETVSADGLPTAQIDGVVWQQAIVGDLVYAGGEFANARPAGALPGVDTVTRNNLLRYSVSTGVLDASWAPSVNAPIRAVATSPDGKRLYIGGGFTTVAGVSRYRIAAFDTATGALITTFRPVVNSQVRAISATNTTVYVGGIFTTAGGQPRTRLAAFSAANGALLAWNPVADNGTVSAVAVSPDASVVVVGGNFTSFNGSPDNGYGLGRVDAVTGVSLPFAAAAIIRNGGANGAILGLSGDGDNVYGVGFTFGRAGGTLEGVFAASWTTGDVTWVLDCHGDTYAVYPAGDVLYAASHHHYCGNVRGNPQVDGTWYYYRADAMTKAVTQTVGREHLGYTNFEGQPAPTRLNWLPELEIGLYTGQGQAAWAVTGNAQYVVMGGEFAKVNDTRQQGLVRFAARSIAPNKEGPKYTGVDFTPRLRSIGQGAVRIAWPANADLDNEYLTYRVIRDGNTASPAYAGVRQSQDWDRPWMGFTDTGLTAGATYTYRVIATDPFGNAATSETQSITVDGSGTLSAYARTVLADGVSHYWRLGDGAGTAAVDSASGDDAVTGEALTRGDAGAIAGDPDTAFTLTSSLGSRIVGAEREQNRNTVSVEAWIRTTTTQGGRIVGFGSSATPGSNSSRLDRHLYMDNQGRLLFGVSPGANRAVSSTDSYNDGQWHHVVGTLGADGVSLSVDGARVAAEATWTTGRNFTGFWRIGGDNLNNWANVPSTRDFAGSIDEVAVYPMVLSPATIAAHNTIGRTGEAANQSPVAVFTSTVSGMSVTVNGSGSTDPDGSIASYAWVFGDGATGSGVTASHTYAAAGPHPVTLTVTDNNGATGATARQVTVTAPPPNLSPIAAVTATSSGLGVTVNGSGSTDPDGTIATYAWAFGDGVTASGATASHTYAAAGTYPVTLTVTDDDGATGVTLNQVTVSAPPAGVFATDSFARVVTGGWGTADVGGPWTTSGAASGFSVAAGAGSMRVAGANARLSAHLAQVAQTSTEVRLGYDLTAVPSGSGTDVEIVGRGLDNTQGYRLRCKMLATGVVRASLVGVAGGTTTTLAQINLPGVSYAVGDVLRVRLQVTGTAPTTLRAKVWTASGTEPAAWQLTGTSATAALQVPGRVGASVYTSSSSSVLPLTVRFGDLRVGTVTP